MVSVLLQVTDDEVEFGMHGLVRRVPGRLDASPVFRGAPPPLPLQCTLVRLVFALHSPTPEAVLLLGPTSHKSLAVRVLADVMYPAAAAARGARAHPRLTTLHLSRLTESADLVGSVQPFTRGAFVAYLTRRCSEAAAAAEPPHSQAPVLAGLVQRLETRGLDAGDLPRLQEEVLAACAEVARDLGAERLQHLVECLPSIPDADQGYQFLDGPVVQMLQHSGFLMLEVFVAQYRCPHASAWRVISPRTDQAANGGW